jgi:hypothetical protein
VEGSDVSRERGDRFTQIAGTPSQLVALDEAGRVWLYDWDTDEWNALGQDRKDEA